MAGGISFPPKRTRNTIPDFLSPNAPDNRLDICAVRGKGDDVPRPHGRRFVSLRKNP
jgi:hypothetical protein